MLLPWAGRTWRQMMDKKGQAPVGQPKVPKPKPNNPKYIKGVATPDTKK